MTTSNPEHAEVPSPQANAPAPRHPDLDFLAALEAHLVGPSHDTWIALSETAAVLDGANAQSTGQTWSTGLGDRAEALLADDGRAWTALAMDVLDMGGGLLSFGPGERLKAMSPFAGRTLVTYDDGFVGGEVALAFQAALGDAGAGMDVPRRYLVALDRGDLKVSDLHEDDRR